MNNSPGALWGAPVVPSPAEVRAAEPRKRRRVFAAGGLPTLFRGAPITDRPIRNCPEVFFRIGANLGSASRSPSSRPPLLISSSKRVTAVMKCRERAADLNGKVTESSCARGPDPHGPPCRRWANMTRRYPQARLSRG
ncbi:hypothetical protein SKAU_G00354970 [Synaphobranchus kaupii]|uniref:Uncharacterized protein n=1 Tax=Synaphobranchus kaupii TaxID=118154 RepID=A0A9Q1EH47_SYNKA|nr:hypothetical protein SKAU_G00354970 [Synaphobranchus kaupii]